jgi:hypothetical protein
MKAYGGVQVQLLSFTPRLLCSTGTRWLRCWVGSQASLDAGLLLGIEPCPLSPLACTTVDVLTQLLQAKHNQKQETLGAGLIL